MKYFGDFSDRDQMAEQFGLRGGYKYKDWPRDILTRVYEKDTPEDFPTDDQVLFASYGGGDYCGAALVIYEKDGKIYEVNGGHCSCYGLEDQWKPEETSWEALCIRKFDSLLSDSYDWGAGAKEALQKLLSEHEKPEDSGEAEE